MGKTPSATTWGPLVGLLFFLLAACSQSTTHQKIALDETRLPSRGEALEYLGKHADLEATLEGVQCYKYENFFQGFSEKRTFHKYEDLYIYSASTKVVGDDQPRNCLMIGARPYKNNAFMVGNHRSLGEFFNLNRFGLKVWFRYFAVYECSEAGGTIDRKTVEAFLSLGAKVLDESTLE